MSILLTCKLIGYSLLSILNSGSSSEKILIPFKIANTSGDFTVNISLNSNDDLFSVVAAFISKEEISSNMYSVLLNYIHSKVTTQSNYVFSKPRLNSFDIFDTILARELIQPEDVFDIVEKTFPYPNFKVIRQTAAMETQGNFDEIYDQIKENEKLSYDFMNRLKEFEFQVELNKTYLVHQNYRLIKDGDILISDMYLSEERIHRLLESAGYDKHTKVYVSNGGKREGW